MPLYEYKCSNCGHEFEEIVSSSEIGKILECKICKGESVRKEVYSFGVSTKLNPSRDVIYSSKEIDKVVGDSANKRWEKYAVRREKRWKGRTPGPVNIPKNSDGTYTPIMHLGNNKEKEIRKKFSELYKTKHIT